MHINVYFKECVNGAIKKSDKFYPSFVYQFKCMRFIFLLEKINSLEALQLVDFSNLTVNVIPMSVSLGIFMMGHTNYSTYFDNCILCNEHSP